MSAVFDQMLDAAAQEAAEDVKKLAGRIEFILRGLEATCPELAKTSRREVLDLLGGGEENAQKGVVTPLHRAQTRYFGQDDGLGDKIPEIESDIMSIIAEEGGAASLTALHERLQDIGSEISKGTLSVRLHRMAMGGRIVSPSRSIYALPQMEKARRRDLA